MPPANFAGRVGAFMAELSYQMLGYAAYLIPLVLVVLGWHYFWCRDPGRRVHEARRRRRCSSAASRPSCRSRSARSIVSGKDVPRRRLHRRLARGGARGVPEPDRLDHPDPDAALPRHHPVDAVLVRPAVLRPRAARARSLGAAARQDARTARGEAARQAASGSAEEASRQGAEGIPAKGIPAQAGRRSSARRSRPSSSSRARSRKPAATIDLPKTAPKKPSRTAAMVGAAAAALKAASSRPTPPAATIKRPPPPVEASLPLVGTGQGPRRAQEGDVHRSRRSRCSTRQGESGRSTSASSWTARGCSRRSAASSPSKARSSRSIPARSSRPTSSSRTPA